MDASIIYDGVYGSKQLGKALDASSFSDEKEDPVNK